MLENEQKKKGQYVTREKKEQKFELKQHFFFFVLGIFSSIDDRCYVVYKLNGTNVEQLLVLILNHMDYYGVKFKNTILIDQ